MIGTLSTYPRSPSRAVALAVPLALQLESGRYGSIQPPSLGSRFDTAAG